MSFQVGDKVVRVAPVKTYQGYTILGAPMVKGGIYVVESIAPSFCYSDGADEGIYLIGCRAIWRNHTDTPWGACYFRKLDELKAESRERYYREHPEIQPA